MLTIYQRGLSKDRVEIALVSQLDALNLSTYATGSTTLLGCVCAAHGGRLAIGKSDY